MMAEYTDAVGLSFDELINIGMAICKLMFQGI